MSEHYMNQYGGKEDLNPQYDDRRSDSNIGHPDSEKITNEHDRIAALHEDLKDKREEGEKILSEDCRMNQRANSWRPYLETRDQWLDEGRNKPRIE